MRVRRVMAYDERTEDLAKRAAGGDREALNSLLRVIQPDVLRRTATSTPRAA